jgi:REP element-mobilizing transposase RayT
VSRRAHLRRSIRLRTFDYASTAVHFVTLCVRGREKALGEVADGRVVLSANGRIVEEAWRALADRFPYVWLDDNVVMPDHFHGIIALNAGHAPGGNEHSHTFRPGPPPRSLGAVIGAFKTVSAKQINALRGTPGQPVWQRNYYEHVVRNEPDLQRIRQYIANNPLLWRPNAPDA